MTEVKRPKTGGRKAGTPNRRTREIEAAARQTVEQVTEVLQAADMQPFDGDAHALLVAVYKNPAQEWNIRVDAAKVAIRYEKPALQNMEMKHSGEINVRSKEQRDAVVAAAQRADD